MVMEIISHTSLYLGKQIVSLAVGVIISFLDILIATKKKKGREEWGMVWKLSYDLELSVPSVLASPMVFYSHSSGTAEPGTAEPNILAKHEWCPVTCCQMEVAALEGEKALPKMTIFNLAGMVSSSWPSCLLSGCGH